MTPESALAEYGHPLDHSMPTWMQEMPDPVTITYPTLTFDEDLWETNDHDPESGKEPRLYVAIVINRQLMHLEAVPAAVFDDQQIIDSSEEFTSNLFLTAGEPGDPFTTTTIRGKEYVLVALPFND